tara:strand:- start:97 stop:438 length:342 start_codon:yes stop_codon:yes gene_type:complete
MVITKERVKDGIENGIIYPDGHQILAPEHYEGFDVTDLIETHYSDFSSPTTTIWGADGEPMEKSEGVYNLTFLYWVAKQTKVPFGDAYGRGTQARLIVDALVAWSGADADACR